MEGKMNVSSNPHIRDNVSTSQLMIAVVVALLPATAFGVWNFGLYSLALILVTVGTAVLSEFLFCKIIKKKSTITDGSALVTGLLLALNLPPRLPLWMGALGALFAIVVVKMVFGGLGQNFMNPALAARCFLLISFAKHMTNFTCDAYTGATPLAMVKTGEDVELIKMIFGNVSGSIGETSVIAILFGACFLILLGVIDMKIPGSYIFSFIFFILIFGKTGLVSYLSGSTQTFIDFSYLAAELSGGGLMLGAFFMATDYVTSPITPKGQILYGIFLGLLTGVFRVFGPSAEGVSYAIIIGNLIVPLIEKVTVPKAFGKEGTR